MLSSVFLYIGTSCFYFSSYESENRSFFYIPKHTNFRHLASDIIFSSHTYIYKLNDKRTCICKFHQHAILPSQMIPLQVEQLGVSIRMIVAMNEIQINKT